MLTRRTFAKTGLLSAVAGGFLFNAKATRIALVTIKDYQFSPRVLHIRSGDTVRWMNGEKRASHSILFLGEKGLESDRLFPGDTWDRQFTHAGPYNYTCGPHPEMSGEIVVTD